MHTRRRSRPHSATSGRLTTPLRRRPLPDEEQERSTRLLLLDERMIVRWPARRAAPLARRSMLDQPSATGRDGRLSRANGPGPLPRVAVGRAAPGGRAGAARHAVACASRRSAALLEDRRPVGRGIGRKPAGPDATGNWRCVVAADGLLAVGGESRESSQEENPTANRLAPLVSIVGRELLAFGVSALR